MNTYICTAVLVLTYLFTSHNTNCLTVNVLLKAEPSSKIKIQKNNTIVNCKLGDIIKISLPKYGESHEEYYLHRPNGEVAIFKPLKKEQNSSDEETKNNNDDDNFKVEVFGTGENQSVESILNDKNDDALFLGPLMGDDHGNWILSKFYQNYDNEIVEEFSTISVLIIENIPQSPNTTSLFHGEDFHVGFPYPLLELESCQLIAPRSTFDRDYEGDVGRRNYCGFVVRNVTAEDAGVWGIIAVGKIIYATQILLQLRT